MVTLNGVYGDVRPLLARFKKPVLITPNVPHRATIQFRVSNIIGSFTYYGYGMLLHLGITVRLLIVDKSVGTTCLCVR